MIAIIGAGISGLTLAYFLQKNGVACEVFEQSDTVGGFIKSEKVEEYWLEYGPNSLLCGEEVSNFVNEIGLQNDVIEANEVSKKRFIVKGGKLTPLPSSPLSLLFGSFFSWSTKKKIFKERKYHPTSDYDDETLTSLIERHFGDEVVEYLLRPFIAGIYAGDPDQLIAKYSFPKLKEYEREYGSILKGFIKNKGGARRRTVSFKEGMEQLPRTISQNIRKLHLGISVKSVNKNETGYSLYLSNDEVKKYDQVVFATSPYDLHQILGDQQGLEKLLTLKTPSITAVHSVYNKEDVRFEVKGFGALNPRKENLYTAGTIWSSAVFDHKVPKDKVLFTTFVGGMQYLGHDNYSEEEIKSKVAQELELLYDAGDPVFQKVTNWKKSIPQYGIEMKEVLRQIDILEKDNIFVCSNWKSGISIEDCIKNAKILAQRLSK